jgi:hypothetical protein
MSATPEAIQKDVSAKDPAAAKPADPATPLAPEYVPNPRDAILDGLDTKIDAQRHQEQKEYLEEVSEELGMAPPAPEPDPNADGAQAVQPMHPPAEPVTPEPLPADLQNHEMASYIVMHNGEPHMKAKVHGIDKLIPMSKVQAQAQKLEAAEVNLEQAAILTKDLAQREEWIRTNEASLKARLETPAVPALPAGVPEEELIGEAKEIVSTLYRGDEDSAATKLAHLLKRSQAPANAAPAIDTTQIVNQAAAAAVNQMTERDKQKDAVGGLEKFTESYPEIMADPNLYRIADNWTDTVEEEHPDWTPTQVMLEAGALTTKWLAQQRGITPPGDLPPADPASKDPNRQERKDNLVRIPNPALGAVSPHGVTEEPVQTPNDALAEIRESRGQPAL